MKKMFFRKKESEKTINEDLVNEGLVDEKDTNENETSFVKYSTPRILCIDIEKGFVNRLRKDGFNVAEESFGRKYKLKKNATPTGYSARLHSIYIIYTFLINMSITSVFNPRIIASKLFEKDFSKITDKDSIFIVLTDKQEIVKYTSISYDHPGV